MSARAKDSRFGGQAAVQKEMSAPGPEGESPRLADSLWIYHVGLSCCGQEVEAAAGPRFDWERLG
ncbi:MAG: hypothetical protein EOP11_22770, partial [Proteobacteria bacterium]